MAGATGTESSEDLAPFDVCLSGDPLILEQANWLAEKLEGITTEIPNVKPSEWTETKRWLPSSISASPGPYSFDRSPFLKEILDAMGPDSPCREGAFCKGAQLGATTNAENLVGYCIEHQSAAPILWVTADQEMATQRLQANIIPMIQQSGLVDRIKSNDEGNARKTGKTDKKLEWIGGGSLRPIGAQSDNKLSQDSAQILIRDEIDRWPEKVGVDGDPLVLSFFRTQAFQDVRKVFDLSTPNIKGASRIWSQYLRGDQRKYFVKCLRCRKQQTLKWRRTNRETGEITGIVWDTDTETGQVVPGSVRYLCEFCSHPHREEEKAQLISSSNAQWIPTATPVAPYVWSWHLPSLYSLLQSWESCVQLWLEAWDPEKNRPKDVGKLQVFYNNVLGEPFEVIGERLKPSDVNRHKRDEYQRGTVPLLYAKKHTGSPISLLTAAVDVQKDFLSFAVWGWTRGKRGFLVDYKTLEGPTTDIDEPTTWGAVREIILKHRYPSEDGRAKYPILLTLVDSGYRATVAHSFVASCGPRAVAIRGENNPKKIDADRRFSQMKSPLGTRAFEVAVNYYKDQHHLILNREWSPVAGQMPEGCLSFPGDITGQEMNELTVERRVEEVDPRTKFKRFKWVRPDGSRNEMWDLLQYSACAVDLLAWDLCINELKLNKVSWAEFWGRAEAAMGPAV